MRWQPKLHLGPCWGSLQCSADLIAGLRGREEKQQEGRGRGKRGRGGGENGGEGREG